MSAKDKFYIGLMSGTSMDGVDAALVNFSDNTPQLMATHSHAFPSHLLTQLQTLADPRVGDINLLGQCDRACGELFAQATLSLLDKAQVSASQIIAIGSHGQTVRHMPNLPQPFSLQIGDGATIAATCDIDTVADFRRKDIALGGQGAPLVPAFHQQLFQSQQHDRVILNIGGISNITWLDKACELTTGFDTGPGNTLLDLWFQRHFSGSYDEQGKWSSSGKVNQDLLAKLLNHAYFSMIPPKSTGRELFNLAWLEQYLSQFSGILAQDVQATLSELTAVTICNDIKSLPNVDQVFVCGGGVFNLDLMARIRNKLPQITLDSTQAIGLAPQWVEAIAFAWLAHCFIEKKTSNLPKVTGAKKAAILGAFYPAN